MCYCASKRWFRQTSDLINCSFILTECLTGNLSGSIFCSCRYWYVLIIGCFGWDVCYWLCSVYNSEPAFRLCFRSLHLKLVWRNCDCDLSWGDHVQWSSPDMVDEIYDIYRIPMGTTHCATLGMDCRILKQKNSSEGSDVSSAKKREQQPRQQPQC